MIRPVNLVPGVCGLLVTALLGGAATSPAASRRGPLPPPSLQPSAAWLSVTTGSSNVANLAPLDNFDNLRHPSRSAVYLWATTAGRGSPDATFKRAEWPLLLSRFRVDR